MPPVQGDVSLRGMLVMLVTATSLILAGFIFLRIGDQFITTPLPRVVGYKIDSSEKSPDSSANHTVIHKASGKNVTSNSTLLEKGKVTESSVHAETPATQIAQKPKPATTKPVMKGNPKPLLEHHPQLPAPIPFMGDYHCSDTLCAEFLTKGDQAKARCDTPKQSPKPRFPGKCHFMNGTNRPVVFLMSYPGSGNTWVRGLLEQATGICTGSIYCDWKLKRGGFNGENLKSGTVLVTKSHVPNWPPGSKLGIMLVRNPLDAYVAEWNRERSGGPGHVGLVGKEFFGNNSAWNKYVHRFMIAPWINYFKWVVKGHQTGRRVLVVRYEDLKSDLMTQMKRMLDFLGVPYSDEALQERMSQDFGKFHRKHNPASDFDHYTAEQRNRIKGLVRTTINFLKSDNNGVTYNIEEYLL